MRLSNLSVLSLALLPLSQASALHRPRTGRQIGCNAEPSTEELAAIQALADADSNGTFVSDSLSTRATISVKVYFHALVNTSVSGTYPSDALFQSQLKVMNTAYAASGVQFVLAGSDRIKDNTLATGDGIFPNWNAGASIQNYLKQYRSAKYADLNLFFYSNPPADTLGQCTFPLATVPASTSLDFAKDGCHLFTGTMPGQEMTNYNLGMSAVHETGHWLSLLHPFTGYSCATSNQGDMIADTPQESTESYGCDTGKDSCPTITGVDPIHNYMDYSDDSCYTSFTAGQATRMANAWTSYRSGK
ncbi:extracellular metalloprotease [Truncatella angustata]|uniref:Extracellular metalloprotease n=1 Tax=Truncatella angustata TaxID=152316 RepID=A0A9P8UEY7_9PEZI|nr:extracellular metalloprotease [Truncatella angustata]KAH6648640.1 extracellular metalloprotease [Truncatella angustata]KAH8194999.1 hypothetical protein TruAng_010838 [Truncatella angustata]